MIKKDSAKKGTTPRPAVTNTQRILIIINLLLCFYAVFFTAIATNIYPELRISFGSSIGDIIVIFVIMLGAIINLILLCICVNERARTAYYAIITTGLIIWLFLMHVPGPIGDCEFTGSHIRGIYYTTEDMDKSH